MKKIILLSALFIVGQGTFIKAAYTDWQGRIVPHRIALDLDAASAFVNGAQKSLDHLEITLDLFNGEPYNAPRYDWTAYGKHINSILPKGFKTYAMLAASPEPHPECLARPRKAKQLLIDGIRNNNLALIHEAIAYHKDVIDNFISAPSAIAPHRCIRPLHYAIECQASNCIPLLATQRDERCLTRLVDGTVIVETAISIAMQRLDISTFRYLFNNGMVESHLIEPLVHLFLTFDPAHFPDPKNALIRAHLIIKIFLENVILAPEDYDKITTVYWITPEIQALINDVRHR